MKSHFNGETNNPRRPVGVDAFTLIELLVVIAVIAILAAMVFPITAAVNKRKTLARARAELANVTAAIEAYKGKLGQYPPDNPGNPWVNQLYFELAGTVNKGTVAAPSFVTLDGDASASLGSLSALFGLDAGGNQKVASFVNSTKPGAGDEARQALRFLRDLKPAQIGVTTNGSDTVKFLLCSIAWPQVSPPYNPLPFLPGANPIRYNSSNPTNNPASYDLWVDVIIAGKSNRICNWSKDPLIVDRPW